jgi:hypothetical protein
MSSAGAPYSMHIEQIRSALWNGRAAVMVGSGFSRNARPIHGAARGFPLWSDLVNRLWRDLHGRDRSPSDVADALRLAEEYALFAGQTALDDLLLEMIPNEQYEPGPLHELLLELPWADVFTTNYDTLLERAAHKVYQIQYDPVYTQADIARTRHPRIVKLHGSFPSHRPFIATAEHYRTYPRKFAGFVNMVQQSIMENVFCMIGFSGDDPNFIQWAGWVRDQLGEAAPKIYFFDVLDLAQNPAKERLFQSMRVIPIDLGPVAPPARWLWEVRRQRALEWLLLSLHQGEPVDLSRWPDVPARKPLPARTEGLPELLAPPRMPDVPPLPALRRAEKLGPADMEALIDSLRRRRQAYPGWRVIPEANREDFGQRISNWLAGDTGEALAQLLGALQLVDRARALHEIVWALGRLLLPLPAWLSREITSLLEGVNPKPDLIELSGVRSRPECPSDNVDELTAIWVELAFALIDQAWTEQRPEAHETWMKRLAAVTKLRPEWRARFCFERCWHHLMRLEEDETRAALREWPEDPGLPFWEAKRAAILADLGDLDEARASARKALERVQRGIAATGGALPALSEEGWILCLLMELELTLPDIDDDSLAERHRRLRELSRVQCNPREDGQRRGEALLERLGKPSKRLRLGFDPGSQTTTHHFRPWDDVDQVIIRTLHDAPWPIARAWTLVEKQSLEACVRHLFIASPRLALALAVHRGDKDLIDELLGRVDVARLDKELAGDICSWMTRALQHAMREPLPVWEQALRGSLRTRILRVAPEVISRLALLQSGPLLEVLKNIAMAMYGSTYYRETPGHHRLVRDLFRRLLFCASTEQIRAWIPSLLTLPIPGSEGFVVDDTLGQWPEPMSFIDREHWRSFTEEDRKAWSTPAQRLIQNVRDGGEVRKRAARRLLLLHIIGGLEERQGRAFADALWLLTDNAFPKDTGFEPWALLNLPERQEGEARKAVARYLLSPRGAASPRDFPQWLVQATSLPWDDAEEQKRRVAWSAEEGEQLLSRLEDLWRKESPPRASELPEWREDRTTTFVRRIVRSLGAAVIPTLATGGNSDAQRRALALLGSIEGLGYPVVEALPATLSFVPDQQRAVEHRIMDALQGRTDEEVASAVAALFLWAMHAQVEGFPQLPVSMLNAWIENVSARRQPGLMAAIEQLCELVRYFPGCLGEEQREMLCRALDYLARDTDVRTMLDVQDELPLEPEERIAVRGHASRLAAYLAVDYQSRSQPMPPAIERWRDIGTDDTLPEVRRVWASIRPPAAPA